MKSSILFYFIIAVIFAHDQPSQYGSPSEPDAPKNATRLCAEKQQPYAIIQGEQFTYALFHAKSNYVDSRDLCACFMDGDLADISSQNIQNISARLRVPAWVNSWNTDYYGYSCLLMNGATINAGKLLS